MKKTLSAVLCALVALLSAGLAPYQAASAEFAAAPGALAPKAALHPAPVLPALGLPRSLPALADPSLTAGIPAVPAPQAAAPAAAISAPARAAAQVRQSAAAVSSALRSYGTIQRAPSESASRAGGALNDAITGQRSYDDAEPLRASVSADLGLSFAKPAGAEIRQAAEAFHGEAAPQPPAPPTV